VLADELSTSAILAGIRAGHSWIAESAAVELSLHARHPGQQMAALTNPVILS
jgi:hypothetical protein